MKRVEREQREKTLERAGLRKTGPRLAVLDVLERAQTPLSHGDVAAELGGRGMDQATVYRNLIALTEAGLVRRTDVGDRVWRFERVRAEEAQGGHMHPHFVCIDCGSVSCLPGVDVQLEGMSPRIEVGRRPLEIQLRGVCLSCER